MVSCLNREAASVTNQPPYVNWKVALFRKTVPSDAEVNGYDHSEMVVWIWRDEALGALPAPAGRIESSDV